MAGRGGTSKSSNVVSKAQQMTQQDLSEAGLGQSTSRKYFDVIEDFNWTVSQMGSVRNEVPYVILREFQQTDAALIQSINFWYQQAKEVKSIGKSGFGAMANPYKGLYYAQETGFLYKLPYYSDYHHTISNSWGDNKGALGNLVDSVVVPVAKVLFPSAGVETAKAWEGGSAASYDITFQLLNTVECKTDIPRNKELVNALIRANLQFKVNTVASLPPVFYEVEIPGIRYSPVSIISNLTVQHKGQMNIVNGDIIPDAYEINIQILELVNESRNLFDYAFTGKKVLGVVTNPIDFAESAKQLEENAKSKDDKSADLTATADSPPARSGPMDMGATNPITGR